MLIHFTVRERERERERSSLTLLIEIGDEHRMTLVVSLSLYLSLHKNHKQWTDSHMTVYFLLEHLDHWSVLNEKKVLHREKKGGTRTCFLEVLFLERERERERERESDQWSSILITNSAFSFIISLRSENSFLSCHHFHSVSFGFICEFFDTFESEER